MNTADAQLIEPRPEEPDEEKLIVSIEARIAEFDRAIELAQRVIEGLDQ